MNFIREDLRGYLKQNPTELITVLCSGLAADGCGFYIRLTKERAYCSILTHNEYMLLAGSGSIDLKVFVDFYNNELLKHFSSRS